MRLTEDQKATVLSERPGADLVRVLDHWCAIWFAKEQPPAARWRGQLVKEVRPPSERMVALTRDFSDVTVWTGSEHQGRTRRAVIDALTAEANL